MHPDHLLTLGGSGILQTAGGCHVLNQIGTGSLARAHEDTEPLKLQCALEILNLRKFTSVDIPAPLGNLSLQGVCNQERQQMPLCERDKEGGALCSKAFHTEGGVLGAGCGGAGLSCFSFHIVT